MLSRYLYREFLLNLEIRRMLLPRRLAIRDFNSSGNENRKRFQSSRNPKTVFYLAAGGLGACLLLGSALRKLLREEYSTIINEYIGKIIPKVNAAEPLDDENNAVKPLSRRERFNFIADVVEETAPSVVYIEIKDTGIRDFYTGQPMTSSNGSGFIVAKDGLILTNAHVVINKPRASILVRLQDGRVFTGRVEDVDVKSDLALVRISCQELPVMKLGSSSTLRPGEWVVAMGSPLTLSNTITAGVVSNKARPPDELGLQGRDVPEYIQTDAAITFGNSGGPLINMDGEAIGINSMKVTPGISFAIPIDYAKEFLARSAEAQRLGKREGIRRYIGITMVTLNPQICDELKARNQGPQDVNHGILIYRVVTGSPSDKAGLRPGDIVTHINGGQIHGSRDVYKLLEGNDSLEMLVCRGPDKKFMVTVRPEPPSPPPTP